MSKKKANYWPHAIVLAIFGVAGLCTWTVDMAVHNPVELDSFYFDSYQNVEQNYNKIMNSKKAFDKRYRVEIPRENFKIGSNSLTVAVKEIANNQAINDANITLVITRPDSRRFDKKPKLQSAKDGQYTFENFDIEKLGRWQIMTKVNVGELTTFKKLEVNATK